MFCIVYSLIYAFFFHMWYLQPFPVVKRQVSSVSVSFVITKVRKYGAGTYDQ